MKLSKNDKRKHRKIRIRKKISGTGERPRLVVYRSNRYIYAQVIDDTQGKTLLSASSHAIAEAKGADVHSATLVGRDIAEKAKLQNINEVVYDRNGYYYHGRVKAVAEGAREGGLRI